MVSKLEKAPRADVMSVNCDDHKKWALHKFSFQYEMLPTHLRNYHPERDNPDTDLGPGYYDEYIPVAHDVPGGNVINKTVTQETLTCPDCDTEARKDERSYPVCPDCGLIVTEPGKPDYDVIIDPKAAGRVDADGNFIK